ncbi:hypothetical protein BDQ17DRAFT_1106923 [Cyathus striatus]|nr:hypothetical protein BDQ17DRAFT_1106923 [Cyathus striatus]
MFKEHETYAKTFKPAIRNAKLRWFWSDLVKNRLNEMVQLALVPGSPLHDKWLVIKQVTPWYFEMNDIISGRRNLKLAIIGNGTPLNLSDYSTSTHKRKRKVEPEPESKAKEAPVEDDKELDEEESSSSSSSY